MLCEKRFGDIESRFFVRLKYSIVEVVELWLYNR